MANTGWTVTGQAPDQTVIGANGQVTTGTVVFFTTVNGNDGSVFVTDAHYRPAQVRAAIQAKANLIDEVGAMAAGM